MRPPFYIKCINAIQLEICSCLLRFQQNTALIATTASLRYQAHQER